MDKQRVRDVIGAPESWPNFMQPEWQRRRDMSGATITDVFVADEQIGVQTEGAVCGETFSTFVVGDPTLRQRLVKALRPGLNACEAVAAEV